MATQQAVPVEIWEDVQTVECVRCARPVPTAPVAGGGRPVTPWLVAFPVASVPAPRGGTPAAHRRWEWARWRDRQAG